jgi:arylsulfate sulfotransferase
MSKVMLRTIPTSVAARVLLCIFLGGLIMFGTVATEGRSGATTQFVPVVSTETPGATPFIANVTITGVPVSTLSSVHFVITPATGSMTTPVSASYSAAYFVSHGLENVAASSITVPVFGLYASVQDHINTVDITITTTTGSQGLSTTITTAPWQDATGGLYTTGLNRLVPRNNSVSLGYSYFLIKGVAPGMNPVIMDTDGQVRWVGTTSFANTPSSAMVGNSFFIGSGSSLYREDLSGNVSLIRNYRSSGITYIQHHNMDPDPHGLLLEVNTTTDNEATVVEVTTTGRIITTFDLATIISAAMKAGHDNPAGFVSPMNDWFHLNSATYWPQRNEIVVSSRENFVMGIGYTSHKIDWILGDPTKAWHRYRSLRAFAFTLAKGSLPPVGQHSISITPQGQLLLFDDGDQSSFEYPAGVQRTSSAPRQYQLNFRTHRASVTWQYNPKPSYWSPICGSVYSAGSSYLVDYASAYGGPELVGLGANNAVAFSYRIQGDYTYAWNALPISLNNLSISN